MFATEKSYMFKRISDDKSIMTTNWLEAFVYFQCQMNEFYVQIEDKWIPFFAVR